MKNFTAKIIVNLKPQIKDVKGLTLKGAVENLVTVQNLNCRVGNIYTLNFSTENINKATEIANKISTEILSNDVIEMYEILSIEEL